MKLRLWADFNEVDDGMVWTSLRRASFVPEGEPAIGQWIELYDHEGNACRGVVTQVRGPIVWLRLDYSTWVNGDDKQIAAQFGDAAYDSWQGKEERTAGAA